jgi:hypothetical protein
VVLGKFPINFKFRHYLQCTSIFTQVPTAYSFSFSHYKSSVEIAWAGAAVVCVFVRLASCLGRVDVLVRVVAWCGWWFVCRGWVGPVLCWVRVVGYFVIKKNEKNKV